MYSDRFAAIVPICGYVSVGDFAIFDFPDGQDPFLQVATTISQVPIWIVHGDEDSVVSVEQSRQMFSALESVGANVTYTELPGVNHNSWDAAYANEDLIAWLFKQSK
jgi:predicted peptidase